VVPQQIMNFHPSEEKVWDAYGIYPSDRIVAYSNAVPPQTRHQLLETLAHEAEHRGRRMLRDTHEKVEDAAKSTQTMFKMANPLWYRDPEYKRNRSFIFPPEGQPTRATRRPIGNEMATRISDILTQSPEERSDAIEHLRQYYLRPNKGINRETLQPTGKVPYRWLVPSFGKRKLIKNPKTNEWDWSTDPKYGEQIPYQDIRRLLHYDQEKKSAEEWLRARRGYPKEQLVDRLFYK